jgi:hypothetical protein
MDVAYSPRMDVAAILIPTAVGAVLGFFSKYLVEVLGRRHEIRTRWDAQLLRLATEFSECGRQLLNDAEAGSSSTAAHSELRVISEQLRLIGNAEVQKTARSVIHHAYAIRGVAEGKADMHALSYPGRSPRDRYLDALDGFYIACRRQLRVRRPADVDRVDPLDAALRPEDRP